MQFFAVKRHLLLQNTQDNYTPYKSLIQDKNTFKYFNDTFVQDKVYSALKYYNLIHLSQPLDTQNTLL